MQHGTVRFDHAVRIGITGAAALGCLLTPVLAAGEDATALPRGKAMPMTLEALRAASEEPQAPWGWLPPAQATSLPDFELKEGTPRGDPPVPAAFREATVILGASGGGFGSGVLISPEGWILTNYHVVAMDAQKSAVAGEPARLRVYLGRIEDGRMRLRPEEIYGTVYRGDPVHDLALVKLESPVPEVASVRLAKTAPEVASACFAVGSQGAGFPWLVRHGNILGRFDYPLGITDVVIAADTTGANLERTRLTILVSDCSISPGDSGGPLLDVHGDLIGLTFATPANLSGGAMGLHVDREEIARFLESLPAKPEAIPFDPWVVGLPFAAPAPPLAALLRDDGRPFYLLQMLYLGPARQPIAELLFFDLEAQNAVVVADQDTLVSLVPAGLWGMESRGGFTYDAFLARRFDQVVAVGFPNASRVVSEIRIDTDGDHTSNVVWKRSDRGSWSMQPERRPLLDPERLGPRGMKLMGQALTPAAKAEPDPDR